MTGLRRQPGTAGAALGQVDVWLLRTPVEGHSMTVHSVTFSPDDTLLASGLYDGMICLWGAP